MKAWKIGLGVLTLSFASACGGGDDDSGSMDPSGANNTGSGSTGNTAATTNGNGSSTGNGGGTTGNGGSGSSTGSGATAGTTGGGSNGATTGSGTGTSTGAGTSSTGDGDGGPEPEPTGACTNAADKAIVDANKIEKLACEGAACAGKNLLNAAGQTKCIAEEAPSLKQLSSGCQACFDAITSCVPSKCVSGLGGSGECSLALPNTDFAKCPSTTPPEAKCEACQMRECAPAFTTCSGIAM